MGSLPLYPAWLVVWTYGQQRLFSGFGNPILLSTLWRHHPIVGLKADGLRIGNRGTMLFCNKPIWLGSYAPATAATAFNAGTNGWLTEAVGLSPSTTENQAAHGTQSNTPMRKKWSAFQYKLTTPHIFAPIAKNRSFVIVAESIDIVAHKS